MQDICTYHVEVPDEVDEAALNAASPVSVQVLCLELETTRLTFQADQTGFIGLVRFLHQQGFVLLSMSREPFLLNTKQVRGDDARRGAPP